MSTRFLKASEIAERFRVSRDAVYLWIRSGRIPSECVIRIAGTVRVDEQKFENLLVSGSLHRRVGQNTGDETVPGTDLHIAYLQAEEARQKAEQHLAGGVEFATLNWPLSML